MNETERRWLASRVSEHEAARAAAAAAGDGWWELQHRREKRRVLNRLQEMHGWSTLAADAEEEVS